MLALFRGEETMALSETQLAGLKKSAAPILEDDLSRVFTALGLRRTQGGEPGSVLYTLKIDGTWQANALAIEVPSDSVKKAYRLDFYVTRAADGVRLGALLRVGDINILQRRGAAVMGEMFQSVDDLSVFACPTCQETLLTWDNNVGSRNIKPGMRCGACGWKGNTGKFQPFRELK